MSLSAPRVFFGVNSVSPYSRTDGTFFGTLKVLQGSSISLSGETVDLSGGASKYPWASEDGKIEAEMSLKVSEYPDFLFELFLGKAPTAVGVDATGTVSTLTNKKGTSVLSSTTGIVSSVVIPSTGAANLKFGKYVVKAISATTIKVYMSSDIDHGRGTDAAFADDTLSVTSAALTITTGGAFTDIADLGIRLTGGSGTIAFVTGDTATFEVKPPSTKSTSVRIGSPLDSFSEFGAIIMGQKRGNQEMIEVDAFRCKGVGLPIGFEANAFSNAEIKAKLLYDSDKAGVFDLRHITPS